MKNLLRPFIFFVFFSLICAMPVMSYDGDMDEYREFKEDLNLARDSYLRALNLYLGEADFKPGFSWSELEFELPEFNYITVKELPGGFSIKGSHGAYKLDMEVRISPKEDDFKYEVKYSKGSNAPGKDIAGEVFR